MAMMNLMREGSWWISSKLDPRWDDSGTGYVGGFVCPSEAKSSIEKTKTELGIEPPDDLEFGYMKD